MRELDHKIFGYFSYRARTEAVLCHGDACIIAETEKLIESYEKDMMLDTVQNITKKTRFGEIIKGLELGAAYAFDRGAYAKFFPLAKQYGFDDLPEPDAFFPQEKTVSMDFIRIQTCEER